MADTQPPAGGKQGKILGMPRTTGIIVIGLVAVVAGYFLISRFSGGSTSSSGQGGGGQGGGGGYYGSGSGPLILVLRDWQGHGQKPKPKPKPKGGDPGEGDDPHHGRNE